MRIAARKMLAIPIPINGWIGWIPISRWLSNWITKPHDNCQTKSLKTFWRFFLTFSSKCSKKRIPFSNVLNIFIEYPRIWCSWIWFHFLTMLPQGTFRKKRQTTVDIGKILSLIYFVPYFLSFQKTFPTLKETKIKYLCFLIVLGFLGFSSFQCFCLFNFLPSLLWNLIIPNRCFKYILFYK